MEKNHKYKNIKFKPFTKMDHFKNLFLNVNPSIYKIYIFGSRRSGKSSIFRFMFDDYSLTIPGGLEHNPDNVYISILNNHWFKDIQVYDFPVKFDIKEDRFKSYLPEFFDKVLAIIFVIDAQDAVQNSLHQFNKFFEIVNRQNSHIYYVIFAHKSDGLNDTQKLDVLRCINANESKYSDNVTQFLTTLYDISVREAFSLLIQRILKIVPEIESILNFFVSYSFLKSVYLCDINSKIFFSFYSNTLSNVDQMSYDMSCKVITLLKNTSEGYNKERVKNDISVSVLMGEERIFCKTMNSSLCCVIKHTDDGANEPIIEYNLNIIFKALQQLIHKYKSENIVMYKTF
ncbi:Rag D [Intoshia linei]|uniref:Rag D n=1 Tax=Intoshia linei TaxID=1819745 RepID=A0A177B7P4_9BILA|nr:Rag D [Intoshia linei]